MKKVLFALAALSLITPTAAVAQTSPQEAAQDIARVQHLVQVAQVQCRRAMESENAGEYLRVYALRNGYTSRDTFLLANLCLMFAQGANYGLERVSR